MRSISSVIHAIRLIAKKAVMDKLRKAVHGQLVAGYSQGTGQPRERKEAPPLPRSTVVAWETKAADQSTPQTVRRFPIHDMGRLEVHGHATH